MDSLNRLAPFLNPVFKSDIVDENDSLKPMMFFIANTFVRSLSTLTSQERKSAERAAFALQLNPANPGFSYERLNNPKDPGFWSARVTDNIRVIVHRNGDRFTLCYVGNHDEAYRWAERRRYDVHPATGAAQFVEIVEREEKIVRRVVQTELVQLPVFRAYEKDQLLALGVPPTWLDAVVGATENNLLEVLSHLPEEAADRLLDIAIGPPFTSSCRRYRPCRGYGGTGPRAFPASGRTAQIPDCQK